MILFSDLHSSYEHYDFKHFQAIKCMSEVENICFLFNLVNLYAHHAQINWAIWMILSWIFQFCFWCLSFSFIYHSDLHNADGMIFISEWNALQHPVASAFLAVVYSDYMLSSRTAKITCNGDSFKPADIRKFAVSQVCSLVSFTCSMLQYCIDAIAIDVATNCRSVLMYLYFL